MECHYPNHLQLVSGLSSLKDLNGLKPIVIGCYYGSTKPSSVVDFLTDFIVEISDLNLNCYKDIYIKICSFICDAPATAFVKNRLPCLRKMYCEWEAYASKSFFYLELESPLRTNESFRRKMNIAHHKNLYEGPLKHPTINVDMIADFPCGNLHLLTSSEFRRIIEDLPLGSFSYIYME